MEALKKAGEHDGKFPWSKERYDAKSAARECHHRPIAAIVTEDLDACELDIDVVDEEGKRVYEKDGEFEGIVEACERIVESLCDVLPVIVARSRMGWHLWLRIGEWKGKREVTLYDAKRRRVEVFAAHKKMTHVWDRNLMKGLPKLKSMTPVTQTKEPLAKLLI